MQVLLCILIAEAHIQAAKKHFLCDGRPILRNAALPAFQVSVRCCENDIVSSVLHRHGVNATICVVHKRVHRFASGFWKRIVLELNISCRARQRIPRDWFRFMHKVVRTVELLTDALAILADRQVALVVHVQLKLVCTLAPEDVRTFGLRAFAILSKVVFVARVAVGARPPREALTFALTVAVNPVIANAMGTASAELRAIASKLPRSAVVAVVTGKITVRARLCTRARRFRRIHTSARFRVARARLAVGASVTLDAEVTVLAKKSQVCVFAWLLAVPVSIGCVLWNPVSCAARGRFVAVFTKEPTRTISRKTVRAVEWTLVWVLTGAVLFAVGPPKSIGTRVRRTVTIALATVTYTVCGVAHACFALPSLAVEVL